MTELTLRSIPVETTCADEDGRLVLADGRLVAVLVRLDDALHEDARGRWHLEAGFGRRMDARPAPYADLPEALAWIAARLGSAPAGAAGAGGVPPGAGGEAGRTDGVGRRDRRASARAPARPR